MPVIFTPRRLLATLIACLLLAPVAVTAQDPPSPSIEPVPAATPAAVASPEGVWLVAAYDAWEAGLTPPLPDSLLRLSFLPGGQLQGETACGRFDGGWTVEGGELFAGIAPTGFLGCADEQTAEATGLNTALAAVVRWQPDEVGGIELLDAAGATRLVLQPLRIGDPTGEWLVTRYRRPNGAWAEPVPDYPMELTLLQDGLLEGSTGCRYLLGGYRVDAGDMTIGPFDTEGLPCEGDVQRGERRLLRALGVVTRWDQQGDALILSSEAEPVIELVRVIEATE